MSAEISKTQHAREMILANPKWTADQVAKKAGLSKSAVYGVKAKMKAVAASNGNVPVADTMRYVENRSTLVMDDDNKVDPRNREDMSVIRLRGENQFLRRTLAEFLVISNI